MPKRRRLLNTIPSSAEKNKVKAYLKEESREGEVWSARGRLKGALMEALGPAGDDSDGGSEQKNLDTAKADERVKRELRFDPGDDGETPGKGEWQTPPPTRQSYVLKLFDRSVDLSQFQENSPLYPICRAWIANQPKANYSQFGNKEVEEEEEEFKVELPGAEGPPVSRIPPLLPSQGERCKDNINLNYREAPPPSREQLLHWHLTRWTSVRQAWLDQSALCEARYQSTQDILNKINVNAM